MPFFEFLSTESQLDAFLDGVPGLAFAANLVQTVRESDTVRTNLKLAMCMVELHRAHRVDLSWADSRCFPGDPMKTRVYFDALDEATDEFLFGTRTHESYLNFCIGLHQKMDRLDHRHEIAKGIVEAHRSGALRRKFDTEFIKKLVAHGIKL